jgi:hypothetical protein
MGGQFISDILFAGLLTVGLAWLLHDLLIARGLLDALGVWFRRRLASDGDGSKPRR